ncbi:MAG: hypothetical protein PHF57_10230 [Methanoregula sp.]|nr:hypothetical protein [Methanoregula sp.]MDD5188569.1 hypothetical protein [Methanoregula sp.]
MDSTKKEKSEKTEKIENVEQIEKIFKEEGIEKEITCPQAFGMAAKHKISKKTISAYCNSHGVKIRGCQLGCFK